MFVFRLSSLPFRGDVETVVVMAVRSYIEPTLEQSEALQRFFRVNWEVNRLCYEAGYKSSLDLQGLSAHTHATPTAHVIFIGERERANL